MGSFADFKRSKTGRQLGKIETHLAEKLKKAEWGEFRIGALFSIGTGSLLSSDELISGNIPRISAKSENNGIIGYYDTDNLENARHFENFISVNFFGSDGGIFYHPYKASLEMKVHTLKIPNYEFSGNTGKFIAAALNNSLKGFDYGNQLSSSKLKELDLRVKLPTQNGKIDFAFMENFIAELKALRVAELHAYLLATGLSNYTLNDDEKVALSTIETAKWQIFNVEELFGKSTRGKRLKSADRILGELPFVTAGEADTGISAFIGNHVTRFKPNTITIDMFGSAKYRNYEYGADDHIAVVHTDKLPKHSVLFLTSAIHKIANAGQFSYARNFYAKDADTLNIELPVKDNKPDFDLMANYLQAIEKLVIKEVVAWADKQIEATEQVILN